MKLFELILYLEYFLDHFRQFLPNHPIQIIKDQLSSVRTMNNKKRHDSIMAIVNEENDKRKNKVKRRESTYMTRIKIAAAKVKMKRSMRKRTEN